MPTTRAKKAEIARRRQMVADMYVCGQSQTAIAEKLAVAQATVSYDLKHIQQEWRDSRIRDFDAARELEIKKLDRVEREAWEAWERSQKPSQSAEFKDDAVNTPTRKKVKNQNGDPRFLVVVHQCITSRRALLGLDALPPLPPEETKSFPTAAEHAERIAALAAALRDRRRVADTRTIVVAKQPGDVRSDSDGGEMEDGPAPGTPGLGDHGVD